MELNEFVKHFADQFDDTDLSEISAETSFRDLDEWSSLIGLSVLNMIEKKCGVNITFDDMRKANTVQDLYEIVANK
ncbi:MAG: acyl carrier protein [Bacteroidales bacterium]|nr:acyl carrier protein [Bacteroidales bacterium]